MIKSESAARQLNEAVNSLINQGLVVESIGIADVPIPVKIESVNNHAAKRMLERGMTESDAQSFIDNAMVMFVQDDDTRRLYISSDGNSAVLIEGNKLLSAYTAEYFDDGVKRIIEEVKKYG